MHPEFEEGEGEEEKEVSKVGHDRFGFVYWNYDIPSQV